MQNEYTNIKEEPNHCSTGEKVARGMLLKRDEQTLWRHFMRLGSGGGLDEESAPDERTRRDLTTVSQSVSQCMHQTQTADDSPSRLERRLDPASVRVLIKTPEGGGGRKSLAWLEGLCGVHDCSTKTGSQSKQFFSFEHVAKRAKCAKGVRMSVCAVVRLIILFQTCCTRRPYDCC